MYFLIKIMFTEFVLNELRCSKMLGGARIHIWGLPHPLSFVFFSLFSQSIPPNCKSLSSCPSNLMRLETVKAKANSTEHKPVH